MRIQEDAGNVEGWPMRTSQKLKESVTASNYSPLDSYHYNPGSSCMVDAATLEVSRLSKF